MGGCYYNLTLISPILYIVKSLRTKRNMKLILVQTVISCKYVHMVLVGLELVVGHSTPAAEVVRGKLAVVAVAVAVQLLVLYYTVRYSSLILISLESV